MKVDATRLPGVLLIEPKRHGDHRGFFAETYSQQAYAELGVKPRSCRITTRCLLPQAPSEGCIFRRHRARKRS